MVFDTARAHLEEPGAAVPAPLPGLLLGPLASGPFVLLARVKPASAGLRIDIPHPSMQVPPHDRAEAIDGDRARRREGWPARGGDGRGP